MQMCACRGESVGLLFLAHTTGLLNYGNAFGCTRIEVRELRSNVDALMEILERDCHHHRKTVWRAVV